DGINDAEDPDPLQHSLPTKTPFVTTTPAPTTPPPEVEIHRDGLVYTTNSGNIFYHPTGADGLTQPQKVYGVFPASGETIYNMAVGDFDGK
ncbi:MAG: hypothetical protein ACE5J5_04090, partial [Candidatus Hydrothermarchaeales archaeon]